MSWKEVAEAFRTSWDSVYRAVGLAVAWGLANRNLGGIEAIGVDEVLWHRGHKYLTVVYQIDGHCRHLLWAGKFLDRWCTKVMRSRIEPMKKMARTICGHRELILNWFEAEGTISAGIVEGLNNKLKVTIRRAYGYKHFKTTEIALYHALGRLPKPNFTHRFL